jgi:competence protein ComFC
MKCLYCGEMITPVVSWGSLFSMQVEELLCERCVEQLEPIEGECCVRCSRPFEGLAVEFRKGDLCYDCVRWEQDPEWSGILERNISLYEYNDFLREFIGRFKFRGDYILAKYFNASLNKAVKELKYDLLVPIPLSEERLYERGFNQSEALIIETGLTPTFLLKRTHTEKQSKKSRRERIHLEDIFKFVEEGDVVGKKVVLVDDIYTTGSTIMHAGKILKQHGASDILSITVARG